MYTLQNCEKLWQEAGKHGTAEERMARTARWEPYYSFLAELQGAQKEKKDMPFAAYLAREGLVDKNTSLLDIGAGMGNYTLAFASLCGSVTALEPVAACADVLMQSAGLHRFENVKCINGLWETFEPEDKYDVTFASMCPAICDVAELLKMESITRRTCCLVAVQRGSYDKHRKAMLAKFGIKPEGGMTTEAIHYINALYLMGRQPNVKFISTDSVVPMSRKTVLERYCAYFEIFGKTREESERFLEEYFEENAVDGVLTEESSLKQALIYWTPGTALK